MSVFKTNQGVTNDENIDNYGYIGTSILWIYQRYIDRYFDTKYW